MLLKLTELEQQVYEKALLGFKATDMAKMFGGSVSQLQKTLNRIYKKRGVNGVHQLLALRIAYLEDQLHRAGVDYE